MTMRKKIDPGSAVVIALTFVVFILAVFLKGIGKDLLLEAGVLLVSVKLISMSFKNAAESQAIREDLDQILVILQRESPRIDTDEPDEARVS